MFKSSQQQARIRRTEVEGIRERERERNKAGKQASLVGVGGVACVGDLGGGPLTEGKGREVAVRCPRKENRARKGSG